MYLMKKRNFSRFETKVSRFVEEYYDYSVIHFPNLFLASIL